ncbi:MAG: DNA replication/repair protein RecF [Firmicutes bacterium]|nr:DNA replication/repair protein RecF [Bacillota bacterium]
MQITNITIIDFRNYKRQSITLCPFVNLITGQNAQGKTNLLEALYLSAIGKSARTTKDKELIRWEQEKAKIVVEAKKSYGLDKLEIILDKSANKRIAVNGLPISKMGELMGIIRVVFFSPDEMKIIKESPSDRRRFMDIALCQMSRGYFYLLQRYNKIVSQRNKLIKSGQANEDSLYVWDMQLVDAGASIIKTRKGFIAALSEAAKNEHASLTENEILSLEYESIDGIELDEIKDSFNAELKKSRERDLRLGYTNVGPHKDDFAIFIDGVDARKFASQGQQRTAALSLKLAEMALSIDRGESPILLLDDVMGELDLTRQHKLLTRIKGMQAVITCTHLDSGVISALGEHKKFIVENGNILE